MSNFYFFQVLGEHTNVVENAKIILESNTELGYNNID